jgi:hypothetical protein
LLQTINEFLEPIPPGLEKADFLARLESACEGHTTKLVTEGRLALAEQTKSNQALA